MGPRAIPPRNPPTPMANAIAMSFPVTALSGFRPETDTSIESSSTTNNLRLYPYKLKFRSPTRGSRRSATPPPGDARLGSPLPS